MRKHWYWVTALLMGALIFSAGAYEAATAQMGGMHAHGTQPQQMSPQTGHGAAPQAMAQMKDADAAMRTARTRMMSELRASDARLDALISKMNSTTGARKADAMAQAITELAAQRREMWDQVMAMQPLMMRDMMGHMQVGMIDGMDRSMGSMMNASGMQSGRASTSDGGMSAGHGSQHR